MRFWLMALGSLGVVFGDIGTSPLYAYRAALKATGAGGADAGAVIGVASLAIWALILVVTVKYVLFIVRLSNKGEGGVLSLMALAQQALGRRSWLILALGMGGAALFYADALITPTLSVLSAIEGLRSIPSIGASITLPVVLITSLAILVGLLLVQSRGTEKVANWFGPIMLVWFAALLVLGLSHLIKQPAALMALNPLAAAGFLATHGTIGLFVLGSVFLTVTGAEALYADMGHFGRWPLQAAWLFVTFPCLAINYLGQAAYALEVIAASGGRPAGDVDWFFTMAPPMMRAPMVVLSTIATIIASQAVITGAYSISNQAMQLGLLPRMTVKNTSESHSGQIYLPRVNLFLLIGVVLLIGIFKTSEALAHAYGIAVTGTMVITTLLAFMVTRSLWKWPLWKSLLVVGPLLTIDCIFLGANALKILSGGFVPLVIGFGLLTLMWAWMRGQRQLSEDATSDRPPLCDLLAMLERQPPAIVAGTAVFLVDNPDRAPGALLHNLKHNHILHERNLIVTVRSDDVPFVGAADRISLKRLSERFTEVTLTYGFMQSPNVPRALSEARKAGLALDMASTSYFLGRRTVLCAGHGKLPRWLAALFVLLHRNAAAPTDYFHLPPGRVVELGTQAGV